MHERKLFFGVPLSAQIRNRLSRETAKWEDAPILPVRPEHYHVTVLFLGYVSDEDVAEASDIARDICAAHEPFDVLFTGIGPAPDPDQPKMIWLSGEENDALRDLRNDFVDAFSDRTPGSRHFRPHVTLAKLKRNAFMKLSGEERGRFARPVALSEPISSVVLFESVGSGPRLQYLPMGEFPLGISGE